MSSEELQLRDPLTFVLPLDNKFKFTMVNCQTSGYMSPEYAMEGIISVKSAPQPQQAHVHALRTL